MEYSIIYHLSFNSTFRLQWGSNLCDVRLAVYCRILAGIHFFVLVHGALDKIHWKKRSVRFFQIIKILFFNLPEQLRASIAGEVYPSEVHLRGLLSTDSWHFRRPPQIGSSIWGSKRLPIKILEALAACRYPYRLQWIAVRRPYLSDSKCQEQHTDGIWPQATGIELPADRSCLGRKAQWHRWAYSV